METACLFIMKDTAAAVVLSIRFLKLRRARYAAHPASVEKPITTMSFIVLQYNKHKPTGSEMKAVSEAHMASG